MSTASRPARAASRFVLDERAAFKQLAHLREAVAELEQALGIGGVDPWIPLKEAAPLMGIKPDSVRKVFDRNGGEYNSYGKPGFRLSFIDRYVQQKRNSLS